MLTGSAKIEITPRAPVLMDGMIRAHASEGVHDPLFSRCIVVGNSENPQDNFALISMDICGMTNNDFDRLRNMISDAVGIPGSQIIAAATHTHSGPATVGYFDSKEAQYTEQLMLKVVEVATEAFNNKRPAMVCAASGVEETISNYRRLMSKSGKVIMNWESYDPADIVGPLGVVDTEVGVLHFVDAATKESIAVLFNHAGHPNVMSGDNYLISGDYVGFAEARLEKELGCVCAFINGAQGTMDIDGLKDRDWSGVERAGGALADAVRQTLDSMKDCKDLPVRSKVARFPIPVRRISDEDYAWAQEIWKQCAGVLQPLADGVGDDYKAMLYIKIRESGETERVIEMTCITIGDTALISFPGELYTEIGMQIKKNSPFPRTYILGLANGGEGYFPTRKAIAEGGYAEDTRRVDENTEDVVLRESAALLNSMFVK